MMRFVRFFIDPSSPLEMFLFGLFLILAFVSVAFSVVVVVLQWPS